MGLFDWFSKMFASSPSETADDVADRLERLADRFENSGDMAVAKDARDAAKEARRMTSAENARMVERQFLLDNGLGPNGQPMKPALGKGPDNSEYLSYGGSVRNGGSKAWRYNNPGYVRCTSRSSSYGAISCDGEFSIFPDYHTGVRAMHQSLRDEYPDLPLREALEKHLPPDAGLDPDKICQEAGLDPTINVNDLPTESFDAFGNAMQCQPGWTEGVEFDRSSDNAPEWAETAWSQTESAFNSVDDSGGGSDSGNDSGGSSFSDNS